MNRLEASVQDLARRGEIGIAPYVTAGDGGMERTLDVLFALEGAGAACVELGVPFSDPIADGPILQAAAQRSLDAGTTVDSVLELVSKFRAGGGELPILFFSYSNPLYVRGLEAAAADLRDAGADGWLVPDVPVEEFEPWSAAAIGAGLAPVGFVTPTTRDVRIERVASLSRGFVYAIGRVGITGAKTDFSTNSAGEFLERASKLSTLPLGVGFGLRNAEQVAALQGHAALAIVGSALVAELDRVGSEGGDVPARAASFIEEMRP